MTIFFNSVSLYFIYDSVKKKSTFESSVEHSRGVRDRIKDKLHGTFTDEIVADQEEFAKSVLKNAGQSSSDFQ